MKGSQKVTKNQNGAGARPVSTTNGAKKLATKEANKSLKKNDRASVATKGRRHGSPKCETRSKPASMKGKNLSLQGSAITILSEKEWEQVTDMLNNPPELSPKLTKAIDRYKEAVK